MNGFEGSIPEGLRFYGEHPDQAAAKLQIPDNTERLRGAYLEYTGVRKIGPSTILSDVDNRIEHWVRAEYQERVSKSLSAANLSDFKRGASKLVMPSRLMLHVYIWTSHAPYREEWGDFYIHDDAA